jgi:hypothetical protein
VPRPKLKVEDEFNAFGSTGSVYANLGEPDKNAAAVLELIEDCFAHGEDPVEVSERLGIPEQTLTRYYQSWLGRQQPTTATDTTGQEITMDTLAYKGTRLVDVVLNSLIAQAEVAGDPKFIRSKPKEASMLLTAVIDISERVQGNPEPSVHSLPAHDAIQVAPDDDGVFGVGEEELS